MPLGFITLLTEIYLREHDLLPHIIVVLLGLVGVELLDVALSLLVDRLAHNVCDSAHGSHRGASRVLRSLLTLEFEVGANLIVGEGLSIGKRELYIEC